MEAHQVFISYRRKSGSELSLLIYRALAERGYKVFRDVDDLKSGPFNTELFLKISNCTDVVVVLTPNSLDSCRDEDDWLRLEVVHALRCGKNVVPIIHKEFTFPEAPLPREMEALRSLQSLEPSNALFDASMDKLAGMFRAKPLHPIHPMPGDGETIKPEQKTKITQTEKTPAFKWHRPFMASLFVVLAGLLVWFVVAGLGDRTAQLLEKGGDQTKDQRLADAEQTKEQEQKKAEPTGSSAVEVIAGKDVATPPPPPVIRPELPAPPKLPDYKADPDSETSVAKIIDGYGYTRASDDQLNMAWRPLYERWKGKEIPALLAVATKTSDTYRAANAIRLLGWSLRPPEGKAYAKDVVNTLAVTCLASNSEELINASIAVIKEAPVPPADKWSVLVSVLDTASLKGASSIIYYLPEYAAAEKRDETRRLLLSLLQSTPSGDVASSTISALDKVTTAEQRKDTAAVVAAVFPQIPPSQYDMAQNAALQLFRDWDYRACIPMMHEELTLCKLGVADTIAGILADWKDPGSSAVIRGAIERFRYGSDSPSDFAAILKALYKLEGEKAGSYIGEVIKNASLSMQRNMLIYLREIRDPAVRAAVESINNETFDKDVKKAAEAFLAGT